jgi:hypothetical protein
MFRSIRLLLLLFSSLVAGQALGRIHSLERPFDDPYPVLAETNGMVISRRSFPRTQRGDYLVAIVRPWTVRRDCLTSYPVSSIFGGEPAYSGDADYGRLTA